LTNATREYDADARPAFGEWVFIPQKQPKKVAGIPMSLNDGRFRVAAGALVLVVGLSAAAPIRALLNSPKDYPQPVVARFTPPPDIVIQGAPNVTLENTSEGANDRFTYDLAVTGNMTVTRKPISEKFPLLEFDKEGCDIIKTVHLKDKNFELTVQRTSPQGWFKVTNVRDDHDEFKLVNMGKVFWAPDPEPVPVATHRPTPAAVRPPAHLDRPHPKPETPKPATVPKPVVEKPVTGDLSNVASVPDTLPPPKKEP
jgi:hypothetical protein